MGAQWKAKGKDLAALRRIARARRAQRDALGRQVEIEEIGAHQIGTRPNLILRSAIARLEG